jgi:2,4-dichlorophenol 6-monooxygenase
MPDLDVDVLVVGGGGAGLSASIFLSDLGVEHLLVERNPGTSTLPKAHYLNSRTLEIFRQHGLAEAVYAAGMPLDDCRVRYCTSLGGDGPLDARELYAYDAFGGRSLRERYAQAAPGPPTNLPQIRLEPLLRAAAEQRAPGRVRFGHELVSFSQSSDGVEAEIRQTETGEVYRARTGYLIGADGGKLVGPALGVEMEGTSALAALVSNHVTADLSSYIPGDALITHFTRPGSRFWWGALVAMGPTWGKASEEWSITFAFLPDDPTRLGPDEIEPSIREMLNLPDLELVVHRTSEWLVNRVVADRFAVGRVFLSGDAAHQHVPTNGLGLNSAIHDSHNLAWKLAQVLAGHADTRLLETYEEERRPTDLRNADWALFTFFNHAMIDAGLGLSPMAPAEVNAAAMTAYLADNPMGETLRARAHEALQTQRTEYAALDIELGYVYQSDAVLNDGSEPPVRDPMGCHYRPVARPGHRLPHAWLQSGGAVVSTHDLSGASARFVLITGPDGADWRAAAARVTEATGVEVLAAGVGSGCEYGDLDGVWTALSGIAADGAVLVRPDNHVAYRSATAVPDPRQELHDVMSQILGVKVAATAYPARGAPR